MKNYADLGGCYPPQPSASADNTLLDLHNSSYHTQPHPIIANCRISTAFTLKWLLSALLNAFNSLQDLIFKDRQLKALHVLSLICSRDIYRVQFKLTGLA